MPSFINTNISSLNAQRNLNTSQSALATSLERLSSGLRINSAKDDAAGLAISSRMTSQINGNNQATRNANDGISLAQTAEGDLAQMGTNLQRMRDLAVQSANATNSASDRAALQAEVASLAAEIDRVAQNSSFNGVKLLDGSFTAQTFHVGAGATANDQISISSIASARTTQLGGVGTTSAATVTGTAVTGALTAGALTLNGFQVGASATGTGAGQSTDSAFSIATAINAISVNTGVTATANSHSVTGAAATVFTAIAADTFSINGINIGAVAAGGSAPGQGANLAAAVNLVSTQTGVTASASATTGAVTLTAADGRDILIGLGGTATNPTTAAAAKATFLTQTGLLTGNVGTQAAAKVLGGTVGTVVAAGAASAASTATIAAGALTFTGAAGTISVGAITLPGTSAVNNATAIINAINTALVAATGGAALNGVATQAAGVITFTAGTDATMTLGLGLTATDAPTAVTNTTTMATLTGFSAVQLGTQAASALGVDNHGTVSLSSSNAAGIVLSGGNPALAGFTAGTTAATTVSSVSAISAVDVSTAAGATNALAAIDGAIATINSSRASLGAYQNRFASVVTSLQTTSENLTASRSRIMDTDFAAETSQLTRNQILQQAGTAMLAQANQLPQNVLTLLR